MKSWKVGVRTGNDPGWTYNRLRFATKAAADRYGADLFARWTAVKDWHSVPAEDEVNAAVDADGYIKEL